MKVGPTDGGEEVDMGPVITMPHRDRVAGYLEIGRAEGAEVASTAAVPPWARVSSSVRACWIGSSPRWSLPAREIFGPVLSVVRVKTLDDAMAAGRACAYGNGATIFTRSGGAAREFKHRFNAGMIGINVGVPAPMAWFPFSGWNQSFFGDLHVQGRGRALLHATETRSFTLGQKLPTAVRLVNYPRESVFRDFTRASASGGDRGTRNCWNSAFGPTCLNWLRPRHEWIALDVEAQMPLRPVARVVHADPWPRDDPEGFGLGWRGDVEVVTEKVVGVKTFLNAHGFRQSKPAPAFFR